MAEQGLAYLRRAVVVLLAIWCVLGIGQTTRAFLGPTGLGLSRLSPLGPIGMPLRGASTVAAARTLIQAGSEADHGTWLVLLHPSVSPTEIIYVRYQLAHLAYPRRVQVTRADAELSLPDYRGIVAAPGIGLPDPWRPQAQVEGFTAYVQEAR